jgi:hypothetical protein
MSTTHKQFKIAHVTDIWKQQSVVPELLTAEEVSSIEMHRCLKCACGEHIADVCAV